MIRNILTIMSLELTKMKRNHMSWFVIIISVLLLFFMDQFNYFSIEEQFKMIKDFSLGIMNVLSLILVVYFPVSLIKDDIKEKTVFAILSSPVSKTELLLGKFLAFVILLFACVFLNTVSLFFIIKMKGGVFGVQMVYAVSMIFLKYLTLTGYAFLCAVLPLASFLSLFLVFLVFCLGTVKTYFVSLLAKALSVDFPLLIQKIVFCVVPNFRIFDVVESITLGKNVEIALIYNAGLHCIGIVTLTVFMASFIFENQEL